MVGVAQRTLSEVDVILFMIEATSDGIGRGDTKILEKLKGTNKKVTLQNNTMISGIYQAYVIATRKGTY